MLIRQEDIQMDNMNRMNMNYIPSLERKLGVGILETSGAVMVLAYGKTLEKNGLPSLRMLFSP